MQETLTCQVDGHPFTRIVARGRKPAMCDAHRMELDEANKRSTRSGINGAIQASKVSEAALEILTGEVWLDTEFERKLSYVVEQLDTNRRDEDDTKALVKRQSELVTEFHRTHRRAA